MRISLGWRALLVGVVLGAVSIAADAHVHWRVDIGVPFYGYWGPVWSAYPPPAVIVQQPPVVVVQPAAPPGPPPQAYWYYCANPAGYYPQVQQCPGGWAAVPAQPVPAPPPQR